MNKIGEGILGLILVALFIWWVYSTANPPHNPPQSDVHWKCVGACAQEWENQYGEGK